MGVGVGLGGGFVSSPVTLEQIMTLGVRGQPMRPGGWGGSVAPVIHMDMDPGARGPDLHAHRPPTGPGHPVLGVRGSRPPWQGGVRIPTGT